METAWVMDDATLSQKALFYLARQRVHNHLFAEPATSPLGQAIDKLAGQHQKPREDLGTPLANALTNRLRWLVPTFDESLTQAVDRVGFTRNERLVLAHRVFSKKGNPEFLTLEKLCPLLEVATRESVRQTENLAQRKVTRKLTQELIPLRDVSETLETLFRKHVAFLAEDLIAHGAIIDPGKLPSNYWDIMNHVGMLMRYNQDVAQLIDKAGVEDTETLYFVKMVIEPLIEHYKVRDYARIEELLKSRLILWRDQFRQAVPNAQRIFTPLDVRSMGQPRTENSAAQIKFTGGAMASRAQSSFDRVGIHTYEQLITTFENVGDLLKLRGFDIGGMRLLYPQLQSRFPNHPLTIEIQDFLSIKRNQPPTPEKQRQLQLERMYLLELRNFNSLAKINGKFRRTVSAMKARLDEKQAATLIFQNLTEQVRLQLNTQIFDSNEEKIARLRYLEMRPFDEIVQTTGLSVTEVNKILWQVRQKLLDQIEQSPTPDDV